MRVTASPSRWQGALEAALARDLPGFLPGQRWFGSKARRITSAVAEDCVWLREGEEPCALAIVRVGFASGDPERYVLMIALRGAPDAPHSLGTITDSGETRHVVEVAASGSHAITLLRHLNRSHELSGAHGGMLHFEDLVGSGEGALDAAGLAEDHVRPMGAEQSNTSLRLGTAHVFKLFRRLESGENPEVEIGRFLSGRTAFRSAPHLRGSVSWTPAGGEPGTVGALQDLVENQGDGWQWTLDRLEEVFSRAAAPGPLLNEILTLGAVTAELHSAMVSCPDEPGFTPEPARAADARAWEEAFRVRAERVLAMLTGDLDRLSSEARTACGTLLDLRARIESAADLPSVAGDGAFVKVRLHGDYHLGQTLKTAHGFMLIDFEGEPARALRERRELHCALKDVAGMLRSFDYAIETARARAPEGTTWSAAPPPLRETFLSGYEARAGELGAPFLPSDPSARHRWTTFFELDKALYELEYELQNRPAWLHIPARGMLRLLEVALS